MKNEASICTKHDKNRKVIIKKLKFSESFFCDTLKDQRKERRPSRWHVTFWDSYEKWL